jgi:hypothetical protein
VYKQYFYIVILIAIVFLLLGCSNVKMACTMNNDKQLTKDGKEISPTVTDKAKDCVNNPTVMVFKEF